MMFRIKSKGWKEFLSCSFKALIFFPNKDSRKKKYVCWNTKVHVTKINKWKLINRI